MKHLALASMVLLVGCGRIGFDARGDGADIGAADAHFPTNIQYGKASNPGGVDEFGSGVAISKDGSTLVVAAMGEDSDATTINGNGGNDNSLESGAAYVFVRSGGTWVQQAYLKASNAEADDQFGRSVAISANGDYIAVGANKEDSAGVIPADNSAMDAGAVYVFHRTGTTWAQQIVAKSQNVDPNDSFGTSVALSAAGDLLAVSAFNEASASNVIGSGQADNSAPAAGAVYTYRRNGTSWSTETYIKPFNTGAGDRFGESIALSDDGTTLAVGAPIEGAGIGGINASNGSDNSMPEVGAVYVFYNPGSAWTQQAYIKPGYLDISSGTGAYDQFGWSVALDNNGNTLAVGARLEASDATNVNGDPTNMNAMNSGAAFVFSRSGTTWTQQAYVKARNASRDDWYGEAIALSSAGDVLAVGAPYEDGSGRGLSSTPDDSLMDAGAVYTYRRVGTTWEPLLYIKAPNSDSDDEFRGVTLSADGRTLVVGALGEAGSSTGFGGNQADNSAVHSGAVYVIE